MCKAHCADAKTQNENFAKIMNSFKGKSKISDDPRVAVEVAAITEAIAKGQIKNNESSKNLSTVDALKQKWEKAMNDILGNKFLANMLISAMEMFGGKNINLDDIDFLDKEIKST